MKYNQSVDWDWAGLCTKTKRSVVLNEIFIFLEWIDFLEVIFEFKLKQLATK